MPHEAGTPVDIQRDITDRSPVPWTPPAIRMGLREGRDSRDALAIRNRSVRALMSEPDDDVIGRAPGIKLGHMARWRAARHECARQERKMRPSPLGNHQGTDHIDLIFRNIHSPDIRSDLLESSARSPGRMALTTDLWR